MPAAAPPPDLLAQARAGDRDAQRQILVSYRALIRWRARVRGVPWQDLDDVLHEVYVRMLRHMSSIDFSPTIVSRMADQCAIDWLRKGRIVPEPLEEMELPSVVDVEAELASRLDLDRVAVRAGRACVDVIMRTLAGVTQAEQATASGKTRSAIAQTLRRCLVKIRKLLRGETT